MAYTAPQLLSMSQKELDDLFSGSSSGDIPNGEAQGPASLRAYAEGNDDLRLLAQQTGHLQLVRGAHRAVDEGDRDGAIVHRLHILLLEIQRDRPEDDVHRLQDFEQIFRQVEHRLLAAAAGGTPVEGNSW